MPPRRASLFVTCLVDLFYPEIGEASVSLLRDVGVRADFPPSQTCCGQPALNSGFVEEARRLAEKTLLSMDRAETVITPSGSCAAMVRVRFPELFQGTRHEARARELAGKTYELTEFLVDVLGVNSLGGRWSGKVTYHDGCHGLRELGLGTQGRKLVAAIDGAELTEMARPGMCCGFGGTFSVRLAETSTAMADDKIAQADATGAEVVVTGDPGCMMHLSGRLSRLRSNMKVMHIAPFLAMVRDAPSRVG